MSASLMSASFWPKGLHDLPRLLACEMIQRAERSVE